MLKYFSLHFRSGNPDPYYLTKIKGELTNKGINIERLTSEEDGILKRLEQQLFNKL